MIMTTTPNIEGYKIKEYKKIVFGEVITGINFVKDFGAGIRNFIGGRSSGYEDELIKARSEALNEIEEAAARIGADGIIGIDFDYEVLGSGGMLMISVSGTAVTLEKLNEDHV